MADNTTLDPGAGGDTIRDVDHLGVKTPVVAVDLNPAGAESLMAGAMPVTDNAGSLTVDNSTISVVGSGVEATAQRVTIATDSTGVLSVDDNGSTLSVDDGAGSLTVDGTVTANAGSGPFPVSDNAGSLTVDSTQLPAALAANGGIKVEGVAGGVAQPVSGTVTANAGSGPFPVSDNAGSLTVDAPVGTPAFVRLSDGAAAITALPVTDNAGSLTVDAPVGTPAFARLSDGTAALTTTGGRLSVDASGVAVPITDNAGSLTVDGTVAANVTPKTSGGLTTFHLVAAASTNATNVKNSAGQLYGWYVYNNSAAASKLAFHNTAGAPTAGASIFFSIVIPPGSAANVEYTNGIAFSTGIAITTVTGLADTDATAVALNELSINLFYF